MQQQHIVNPDAYIPEMGFTYPEIPDEPFVRSKKIHDVDFENGYPFLDRSLKGRFQNFRIYLGIFALVFPLNHLLYGIKITGREHLRKNRKMFKNGAMTIANHVHRWDFCFVLHAVKFRRSWFPAKKENMESKDNDFIRGAGGIPIPETLAATRRFNQAFDTLHNEKKWIHVFPESCRWNYYEPIRPFKLGAFKMAYRYQIPIIPIAIRYRKPAGIWKLLKVKHPLITVAIGEPISVEKPEGITKNEFCAQLRAQTHAKICELAGIKQNGWQAEGD